MKDTRPVLLDLFCCQGGAAMGYYRAGFRVVGVDVKPQPRYPFEFIQAAALEYLAEHGRDYDAIHASPPCQRYARITPADRRESHPDLLGPTRDLLRKTGLPYIMENVEDARRQMQEPFMLCGTMFGLRTPCGAELRRHRLFETNWETGLLPMCQHGSRPVVSIFGDKARDRAAGIQNEKARVITVVGHEATDEAHNMRLRRMLKARVICVAGHTAENPATSNKHSKQARAQERARVITVTGSTAQQNVERNVRRETFSVDDARAAMGIDWMGMKGLSQAIPPAYTEFIGRQLMQEVIQ